MCDISHLTRRSIRSAPVSEGNEEPVGPAIHTKGATVPHKKPRYIEDSSSSEDEDSRSAVSSCNMTDNASAMGDDDQINFPTSDEEGAVDHVEASTDSESDSGKGLSSSTESRNTIADFLASDEDTYTYEAEEKLIYSDDSSVSSSEGGYWYVPETDEEDDNEERNEDRCCDGCVVPETDDESDLLDDNGSDVVDECEKN